MSTLAYLALTAVAGAARPLLIALDQRAADVAIIRAAHDRLTTLLGRDRADAILREQATRALYTRGVRYSAALSRELSAAVWRAEHPPQPKTTTAPAVAPPEGASVFANLKRVARYAGEHGEPWNGFLFTWREELATLTEGQRRAVADAWHAGQREKPTVAETEEVSIFTSLKREARSTGERCKPWPSFAHTWREEMATLTEEQHRAVASAWFEGLGARR